MNLQRNSRLEELERRFTQLETRLNETPEKEALSILHAMIHETRRQQDPGASTPAPKGSQVTLSYVANLYKTAPAMEGKAENRGLPIGTHAPTFTLNDLSGKPVSLSDFFSQPVVLAFYPLDWSPACSDQLSLYQSELAEFEKFHAQLLAVSVDSIYSHGAWAAVRRLTFPLLSDFHPKGEVARRYQVYRERDGFSERALYVIDREGVIRYCHVSPELHKIPSIYELMDQLKQLNPQDEKTPSG